MKTLKHIILSLAVALALFACSEDPIDKALPSSEFFVTFDIRSGNNYSLTMVEGDTAVITVTMGATIGSSVTVDFDVTPPTTANPATAAYELLNMNDQPMTAKTLTFPEGTGAQQFKFVATDNDLVDGSRTFTFVLKNNSAGYKIGVGNKGEGAQYPVVVKDDEVVLTLQELIGTWTVEEDLFANGAWNDGIDYTISFEEINSNTVSIIGLAAAEDGVIVTATVSLDAKVKTISIPMQQITPTWNPNYDTYFSKQGSWPNGFVNLVINKEDDGTLIINMGAAYTYEITAVEPGTMTRLGQFRTGYGTVLTKEP